MQLYMEQSLAKTTIDQITARAGVAKGTFYNYFTTKEDLLVAGLLIAQNQDLERNRAMVMQACSVLERLERAVGCATAFITLYPELGRVWIQERLLRGLAQTNSGFDQLLVDVITAGQASGALRGDRPAESLLLELEGIIVAYVSVWLHSPGSIDLDPALHDALEGYLAGARPR